MSSASGKTLSLKARGGVSSTDTSPSLNFTHRQKKFDELFIGHASLLFGEFQFSTEELIGMRVPVVFVDLLLQGKRITERDCNLIEVGFQEALTNALEHGNLELASELKESIDPAGKDGYASLKESRLGDPRYRERRIKLSFEVKDAEFRIRIIDEGQGFLPREEDTPDSRKRTGGELLSHGRGMSLIFSSFDEVRYRQWGREIEMVKKLL